MNISKKISKQNLFIFISIALLFIVLSLTVQNFLTSYNIFNIIIRASIYGTMALGLTFVMITGGIDISLPTVMAAGTVVGVMYMAKTGNGLVGCLLIVLVCLIAGAINAAAITALNMPPLIVTLATQTVAIGFAVWYTNYLTITGIPKGLLSFFRAYIFSIPVYAIIFLLIIVIFQFILTKTIFGRWLYFIGQNINTAKVSGVPTSLIISMAYLISALTAAIAGIMLATQIGSAQPAMGRVSMVLDIISSVLIGGVSINGGKGTIIGAALGAVFIALISNVMNLIGLQFYTTLMIKGLIIILAIAFDNVKKR
ncbi:MAG: ABC transporter permease [Atribacterota bacterium]|nr:ABC transporter permease [Atribacterota bacterium]